MHIDRRAFLSASILALSARTCALSAPLPVASATSQLNGNPSFYGNPNSTISVIAGSIFISRKSGMTPCFIHVSASAITCKGTRTLGAGSTTAAMPYEDLEFSWNFGDLSGKEIFLRPSDGASVNANIQVGPEAVYCYRNAGSYTITLTVRGKNGGDYTTATFTQAITVSAFSASNGTRYVDSKNGNNSWLGTVPVPTPAGRPTNGPWADLSNFSTFQLTSGSKALYIAQGSHISGSTGIKFTQNGTSNWRIGSYVGASGAGANPIIEMTAGSNAPIDLGNPTNNGTRDDFVVSNINCIVSTSWGGGFAAGFAYSVTGTGIMSNIYFDNCAVQSALANQASGMTAIMMLNGTGGTSQYWGVWGGAITGPVYNSGNGQKHSFFGGPRTQGLSFYGVSFNGSGSNAILDHHIYPETQFHSVYKWLNFGATGTGNYQRNFCINTNFDGANAGTLYQAAYILMSENSFCNTAHMHDLGNNYNDPTTTQYTNIVVERNAVSGITGGNLTPFSCGVTYTFRDNRVWNCSGGGIVIGPTTNLGSIFQPAVYRNKIYIPSQPGGGAVYGNLNGYSPITFNTTTPIIQGPAGATYIPVGTQVRLLSSGGLPGNFVTNVIYWVKSFNSATSSFTLSATNGGPAIQASSVGWGTISLIPVWSQPEIFTDNVIWDARASVSAARVVFSDQQVAKSLFDRNQYWSAGASNLTYLFVDNSTSKSFTQWRAAGFDPNGSVSQPSWSVPPKQWSDFGA